MIGILAEVVLCHLTTHDGELLRLVDILTRLAVVVNQEAHAQFRTMGKYGLYGLLYTVHVDVMGQLGDAWNIILHDLWKFQTVVEHS